MVFVAIWVVCEKLYITLLGGQECTYLGDCLVWGIWPSQVELTELKALFEPPYLQVLHYSGTIKKGLVAYRSYLDIERKEELPQN